MSEEIVKAEPKKSWIQEFVDKARAGVEKAEPKSPTSFVRETGGVVGGLFKSGLVGSLFGAAHAKWGLDTPAGPADGAIAGLGSLLGIALSQHFPEVASYCRETGRDAFTIFTFRKSFGLVSGAPLMGGGGATAPRMTAAGKGPGIAGEDPIIAKAAKLG